MKKIATAIFLFIFSSKIFAQEVNYINPVTIDFAPNTVKISAGPTFINFGDYKLFYDSEKKYWGFFNFDRRVFGFYQVLDKKWHAFPAIGELPEGFRVQNVLQFKGLPQTMNEMIFSFADDPTELVKRLRPTPINFFAAFERDFDIKLIPEAPFKNQSRALSTNLPVRDWQMAKIEMTHKKSKRRIVFSSATTFYDNPVDDNRRPVKLASWAKEEGAKEEKNRRVAAAGMQMIVVYDPKSNREKSAMRVVRVNDAIVENTANPTVANLSQTNFYFSFDNKPAELEGRTINSLPAKKKKR